MSLIKANAVQIGQSGTATENFTLAVPSSPDGTIKLARGNANATTQDVLSVDASGNVNGLVKATGSTTARSLANRFADVVNVKDFGAVGDGVADDTAAIQAALNSGAKLVYIPPTSNSYLVGSLTMPTTTGFVLQGSGSAGMLKQKAGAGSVITWPTAVGNFMYYPVQTIRDMHFDGSLGNDHIVNTTYVGNVEFLNCSVRNIPTNKSAFYVNGYPASPVPDNRYTHDIYFNSCDVINNTSTPGSGNYGIAGIQLGPYAADIEINEFTFNGNFITYNAIAIEAGCGSVHIEGGHIYNTLAAVISIVNPIDVVRMNGTGLDYSQSEIIRAEGTSGLSIQNCRIQAVQSGQNGITLVNCSNTNIGNCNFDGGAGAVSAVAESGTCYYTIVSYPIFTNITSFSNPFNLTGNNSFVRGAFRNNLYGYLLPFAFCSTANLASNTTAYLGLNGLQTSAIANLITCPFDGTIDSCTVIVGTAPGAGQSHTIELYTNLGFLASSTISGASQFLVNLTIPPSPTSDITKGVGYLYIKIISSATAAPTFVRGFVTIKA